MNKSKVIVFRMPILFNVLNEINETINFEVIEINSKVGLTRILKDKKYNYLVISDIIIDLDNNISNIVLENLPIRIKKLLEQINIFLLKLNYSEQSNQNIKDYKLDTNSRELVKNEKKLRLTQKETEIILFLKNSKKSISISNLQKEVWGHNLKLETHTVETHIYRLRKKIFNLFNDQNFIISDEHGYKI